MAQLSEEGLWKAKSEASIGRYHVEALLLPKGPFLLKINNTKHLIGNDIWNITIGQQYGTKLFYKNRDIVGDAVGHYVSYNGAASNLNWTSASIYYQTPEYTDIVFTAPQGDFHWVIQPKLAGAYQYFVNRALPVLGEFRTLFRLDNTTFTRGKTSIKDAELPALSEYAAATKVQDETWLRADGSYLTKYDFSCFIRQQEFYGVYGEGFGSWYIVPGKDDYNGDHLKQELVVHRESRTGDVVMLNMVHGAHFQVMSSDAFESGKMWGPWLWYLNDGNLTDASSRAQGEDTTYPYKWFNDTGYQSRGSVSGSLTLSDGRPAAGAAVFLGDNHPNETTLDMGRYKYYTTYADKQGKFMFENVRSNSYALQAWSNGAPIGDVSTTYVKNDIVVATGKESNLGKLTWTTQSRKQIWRIGEMDRKSIGFQYGGAPNQHALVEKCPSNLDIVPGPSAASKWCFGQSELGSWTVSFNISADELPKAPQKSSAVLSVSLAGYAAGTSSNILANGVLVGKLTSGTAGLANDGSLYRSATTAGEWRYFEFEVGGGVLKKGMNKVVFQVTRYTRWKGFMWDAVMLEWSK